MRLPTARTLSSLCALHSLTCSVCRTVNAGAAQARVLLESTLLRRDWSEQLCVVPLRELFSSFSCKLITPRCDAQDSPHLQDVSVFSKCALCCRIACRVTNRCSRRVHTIGLGHLEIWNTNLTDLTAFVSVTKSGSPVSSSTNWNTECLIVVVRDLFLMLCAH